MIYVDALAMPAFRDIGGLYFGRLVLVVFPGLFDLSVFGLHVHVGSPQLTFHVEWDDGACGRPFAFTCSTAYFFPVGGGALLSHGWVARRVRGQLQ